MKLQALCMALLLAGSFLPPAALAFDPPDRKIPVWPKLAPGESSSSQGTRRPRRAHENPPATRVSHITQPMLAFFEPPAEKRVGAVVLILPGGGYNYVVIDKEGSEVALWLNRFGITAVVLHYRTKNDSKGPHWKRPLQDTQRALRLLRTHAAEWGFEPDRMGLLGLSAGGQVAAMAATRYQVPAYRAIDAIDRVSSRPDFALLIYPWNIYDAEADRLIPQVEVSSTTPPTFLLHTHDDSSSSLGSAYFYLALKKLDLPAELHVFQNGGHGYGMRPVAGSDVGTWPERATDWLHRRGLALPAEGSPPAEVGPPAKAPPSAR